MSIHSPEASVLSSAQRRCQLILMLCLPETGVTMALVCQHNGVDIVTAREDIAAAAREIQLYYHLAIEQDIHARLWLSGSPLDQHLCLQHVLKRALRLSPDFVQHYFATVLKQQLQAKPVAKALYDEHNLAVLVQHCARQLVRDFSLRDRQYLQLALPYFLAHPCRLEFSAQQQHWLTQKPEYLLAQRIVRCWEKHGYQSASAATPALLALLFSQLHIPHIDSLTDARQPLVEAVDQLIARFQALSGRQFSDESGVTLQLYSHLALAVERSLFAIGIDRCPGDVAGQYPRLLRTTRAALVAFEQHYSLQFSDEETALIAIIFGAWLVQDSALHEQQVLLLTAKDPELEHQVEQMLRELTLLPLNIKYLDVADYQRHSAPKGVALVVSPWATPLPLYSPPFIHVLLPLSKQQQQMIVSLLDA